jgi:hypothetical protein
MKRFHVHVNVDDLGASIASHSRLFDAMPEVVTADYAKWMLDDPHINFAISRRERAAGIDHLGLQAESSAELAEIGQRLAAADAIELAQTGTTRCYAHSDTYGSEDPQGLRRERFHTHGAAMKYFDAAAEAACCNPPAPAADPHVAVAAAGACCGPAAGPAASCCA